MSHISISLYPMVYWQGRFLHDHQMLRNENCRKESLEKDQLSMI